MLTPSQYKQLFSRLSRLLYEIDPEGIGRSILAPPDEYDELTSVLLVRAKAAEHGDRRTTLKGLLPSIGEEDLSRVDDLLDEYVGPDSRERIH